MFISQSVCRQVVYLHCPKVHRPNGRIHMTVLLGCTCQTPNRASCVSTWFTVHTYIAQHLASNVRDDGVLCQEYLKLLTGRQLGQSPR